MWKWHWGGWTGALTLPIVDESDESLPVSSSNISLESSPGTEGNRQGLRVSIYHNIRHITIPMDLRVSTPRREILPTTIYLSSSPKSSIPRMRRIIYYPPKMELRWVCCPRCAKPSLTWIWGWVACAPSYRTNKVAPNTLQLPDCLLYRQIIMPSPHECNTMHSYWYTLPWSNPVHSSF